MRQDYAQYRLRFTVPPDQAGRELLEFVQCRFSCFTLDEWSERIERHRVLVDNAPTKADHVLVVGNRIEYLDADVPEPDVDTRFRIVYQDDHLLVIDKPAGLPCHPGGRYLHNTLTYLVNKHLSIDDVMLVNRLDRETSGLILLALDSQSCTALQQQFAARTVDKRYEVFVEGGFPDVCRAEGYMVPDSGSVVRRRRRFIRAEDATPAHELPADADAAVTEFTRIATDGTISHLAARLETGRQHQIRATLLGLGYPVVGDKLYGVDPALFLRFCNGALTDANRRALRIERQALHARSLGFTHPTDGRLLGFTAPLPPDLEALARHIK